MAFKKQLSERPISTTFNRRAVISLGPLESRGSKMLKAALNNKTPLRDRGALDEPVMNIQQVARSKKRSPKNNVLFREPVVSQQFEYEQTYLETSEKFLEIINQIQREAGTSEEVSKSEQKQPDEFERQSIDRTEHLRTPLRDNKESYDDDDDDDDIYIMASSDESEFASQLQANIARKRLSPEEDEVTVKQTCRSESSGGGLFSSPKVAKIAPYFDDERPIERRATANKNRLRTLQRPLLSKRYTIKRSDSLLAHGGNRFDSNDKVNNLTLSSYKKFSSPVCSNPEPATSARSEQQQEASCKSEANGYLNWFATFITNQMNKLIF